MCLSNPRNENRMSDSFTTVVGNLTRDPELRYTPTGRAVCRLGIAVNRRWQDRQTKEWQEETSFFNVTAWAELGENVAESLVKGDRAVITGRLEQRSWETPEGDKRSSVDIVADEIGGSLRWATGKMTRTAKREGTNGSAPASVGATESGAFDDSDPF